MIRAILAAVGLLTLIPVKGDARPSLRVAAGFPAAGLLVGSLVAGAGWAASVLDRGHEVALVAPFAMMAVAAIATRLMHWDALADVSDALWGGWEPERRREIASDSYVGSFAVAVCVIAGIGWFALGSRLIGAGGLWMVPALFATSRFAATAAAWWGRPAKQEGLGASASARPDGASLLLVALTLAVSVAPAVVLDPGHVTGLLVPFLIHLAASSVLFRPLARAFGGTTGDVMGATMFASELLGLALYTIGRVTL